MWQKGGPDPRWIAISGHGVPDWAREAEVQAAGTPFRTTDFEAQVAADRQGIGITTLPCFVGDVDPLLTRVPEMKLHLYGAVWVLTQGEARKSKRVPLFTEFISRRLTIYAPLLKGQSAASS